MVNALIKWSLHNRLIVILGACAASPSRVHSALRSQRRGLPGHGRRLPSSRSSARAGAMIPEEMEAAGPAFRWRRPNFLAGVASWKTLRANRRLERRKVSSSPTAPTTGRPGKGPEPDQYCLDLPKGTFVRRLRPGPAGEIRRHVLEAPGYTTNQLRAAQDWVLNRPKPWSPAMIDVVGFGGRSSWYRVCSIPPPQAVRRGDDGSGGEGHRTLELQRRRRHPDPRDASRTTFGRSGLLGRGIDPLDPANVERAAVIEAEKLDDIRDVVITISPTARRSMFGKSPQVIVGHRPRLGKVGRGAENDVVEGIVMMRKYEKSLPTANAVTAKMKEIEQTKLLPKGMKLKVFNQRTDLVHVTTHNVIHNLVVGIGLA